MKKILPVGAALVIGASALTFHYHAKPAAPPPVHVTTGVLPDHTLTPGALNPAVTQATIGQNICNKGWSTKSIRPPASYTTSLKIKQLAAGYAIAGDTNTKDYEEDHLISLELGGSPTDPKNLWPESYLTTPNAKDKDKIENLLHARVCAGTITLSEAQRLISTDWTTVH